MPSQQYNEISRRQIELVREQIDSLWTEKQVTFQGQHYAVSAAYCEPKPDPLPPIVIGGQGPRMLQLVARYADGWDTEWVRVVGDA